jgi:LacI family transcriptional regulator
LSGKFKLEWGYEAMAQADANHLPFTAVFCGNDLIALGAMKYLKEKGKHIPEDCSILGFDDIQIASHVDPPLTTVRQPKYQMGYQAVDTMIRLLNKEDISTDDTVHGKKIVLSTELVIRQTCAPAK